MYHRLVLSVLLLAAVVASGFGTAAPARALSCGPCPAATTDYLNLRSAPNLNSMVLLVIPPWQEVAYDAASGPDNGYYQVTYAGVSGYAHGLYLLRFPAPATPSDWLNLRSEPSLDSAVLQVMAPGSNVEVLGLGENGFYSVRWEQRLIGFASSDFLTLDHGAGFSNGDAVVVRTDALNVRARGGLDYAIQGTIYSGRQATVTGGPVERDGYSWYRIDAPDLESGWVAGEFLARR
jgi:uncharacterized protein YgiM (DUF1202 family)